MNELKKKDMVYMCIMEYYPAIKNEILPNAAITDRPRDYHTK